MGKLIGGSSPALKYDGSTATIPVAGEVTVYSRSFRMSSAKFFGVWALGGSAGGTPNLKVELEEAPIEPTTEGSAETTLFVEPDGFDDVFSVINDKVAHIKTLTPVPMDYGRYKITGLAANPADATIQIKTFMQEET